MEEALGMTAGEKLLAPGGRQFILDIGTRSVVGVAGHREGELFVVEGWDVEPHPRRAMIDGQIEDIEQVARVAGVVKQRLEEKLGASFSHVSVAAAGRALKTSRAVYEQDIPAVPITPKMAFALENAAINKARIQLDEMSSEVPYYCVGHSVVKYILDGYPFSNVLGHRASHAQVEIIATFLPAEVVESLQRCMELLDLEIDVLSLEPIAAMRAVIPQDLRLLNLALVDIGAGTSDIAISADNSVAGYTMATVAGDEISEAIIKQFLVDFATAERLKMAILEGGPFNYTDILGFEHNPTEAEVLETIDPAIETLAQVISDKILEVNAGPPSAVFLVGGGSKTPGLCQRVSDKLGLPQNKVALAGTNFSGRILNESSGLDGPEYATPVGIALIAAESAEVEGTRVLVNDTKVKLFSSDSTSVMDALLMAGYRYSDLMGRNGRPITFTLNGARTVVRGEPYSPAELLVNDKPASLSTPISGGDKVSIKVAVSGADATAVVADYAKGERPIRVVLNGTPLLAGLIARVNGSVATPDTPIREQDDVELYVVRTVAQLCQAARVPYEGLSITVNGKPADAEALLKDADTVVCAESGAPPAVPVVEQPPAAPAPVEEPLPEAPTPEPVVDIPEPTPPVLPEEPVAEPVAAAPVPMEDVPALEEEESAPEPEETSTPEPVPEPEPEPEIEAIEAALPLEAEPPTAEAEVPVVELEEEPAEEEAVAPPEIPAEQQAAPEESSALTEEPTSAMPEIAPLPEPVVEPAEPEQELPSVEPEPIVASEPIPAETALETAPFEPEPIAAPIEPELELPAVEPETIVASAPIPAETEPDAAPVEPEPEAIAAPIEPEPELPSVEPEPSPAEPEPTPEAAPPPEPEPAPAEPEPEPVMAPAEPEPEPIAAPAEPAATAAPEEAAEPEEPAPTAESAPAPEAVPLYTAGGRSLRIDLNGRTVVLPPKPGNEPHRMFDMLTLVDIDPANPKGKVKVTLNGSEASYLEELVSGDKVEIGWDKD